MIGELSITPAWSSGPARTGKTPSFSHAATNATAHCGGSSSDTNDASVDLEQQVAGDQRAAQPLRPVRRLGRLGGPVRFSTRRVSSVTAYGDTGARRGRHPQRERLAGAHQPARRPRLSTSRSRRRDGKVERRRLVERDLEDRLNLDGLVPRHVDGVAVSSRRHVYEPRRRPRTRPLLHLQETHGHRAARWRRRRRPRTSGTTCARTGRCSTTSAGISTPHCHRTWFFGELAR